MIHYKCPKCHEPMQSHDSLAGSTTECPKCGLPITVPGPGQTAGPAALLRLGLLSMLIGAAYLTALLGVLLLLLCFIMTQWYFVAAGIGLLLISLLWLALEAIIRELCNIRSELSILNTAAAPHQENNDCTQDSNETEQ